MLVHHTGWLAAGLLLLAGLGVYAWPFTVDDAFITARYARNLALHGVYGFDVQARTDGVTGPLWLAPEVLAVWARVDPLWVAKLVGIGCALLTLWLVQRHVRAIAGGTLTAPVTSLLIATSLPLTIWAVGGLESSAACLACSVLLFGVTASQPRIHALGVAGAALAWLRPELAVVVAGALAWVWLRTGRAALRAIGVVALGALALLVFRVMCFGRLLPLSAYAKPAELLHGARYLFESLRPTASLALLPLLLCALRFGGRRERVLGAALLLHGGAVALAGGDWMPSARLFVPLVPVACFLAARGFVFVRLRRPRLAQLMLFVAFAARIATLAAELPRARASAAARTRTVPALLEALAALPDPVVALDIGALGYFGERRMIDLGGLTEPEIALRPGGHVAKRIDSVWLEKKRPGAIVLHSRERPRIDDQARLRWFAGYPVERSLLAMRWVLERYRVQRVIEHDRKYFYLVLAPR